MTHSFSEGEIRPPDLKAGQQAAIEADLAYLNEHRHLFVKVACPACDSLEQSHAFTKYGFHFLRCTTCATVYMSPRAPAHLLAEFYRRSAVYEYWNRTIFPATSEVRLQKIFRPRARRVKELCASTAKGGGTLLEVGAGFGLFMRAVLETGAFTRLVAVEPAPSLAAHCRVPGVEVIEGPIENVDLGDSHADVVAAFEVVEHLFAPISFLRACAKALPSGGTLIITCPNGLGFDILELGATSDSVDAEHINLVNPAAMEILMDRAGLRVRQISTPGSLDAEMVRKKVLEGAHSIEGSPFMRRVLIDQWEELGVGFQQFLAGNCLSSHMWVVAEKR